MGRAHTTVTNGTCVPSLLFLLFPLFFRLFTEAVSAGGVVSRVSLRAYGRGGAVSPEYSRAYGKRNERRGMGVSPDYLRAYERGVLALLLVRDIYRGG